jgi:hypothetical protein
MIRGVESPYAGVIHLTPTPRRPGRRRLAALVVVISVAVAGGLIGQLSARRDAAHPIPPGPFGYFPT